LSGFKIVVSISRTLRTIGRERTRNNNQMRTKAFHAKDAKGAKEKKTGE